MRSTVSRGQPGPWAMRAYSTWTSSVKFTCAFPLQLHFALQERLLHFAFDLLPENSSDVDFVSHPPKGCSWLAAFCSIRRTGAT